MTIAIDESHPMRRPVSGDRGDAATMGCPGRGAGIDWRTVGKSAIGAAAVGLDRTFGRRSANHLGVLVYHRITPAVSSLPAPTMNVTPETFRRQLEGLLDRGFRVWPLRQALAHSRRGQPFPSRTVVLTFDDGFENVFQHAWPVLRDLRLPATVFVSTAFLDADSFPFDTWGSRWSHAINRTAYRPLRTEQCRALLAGGLVDIGAHTHTHADFRGRPMDFEADLRSSVAHLDAVLGVKAPTFAFPFGRPHLGFVSPPLVAAARRAGVACGLTTRNAVVPSGSDPFGWGRFNAFESDSAAALTAKLDGWYGWAPAIQEWFVRGRLRLQAAKI